MAEQQKAPRVNQVDTVLQDYLDQLLITATLVSEVAPAAPAEARATVSVTQASVSAVQETRMQISQPAVATAVAPVLPVMLPEIPPLAPAQEDVIPDAGNPAEVTEDVNILSTSHGDQEPPNTLTLNWRSSQGIDCLIFKVAGLKLAIPLPLLGGVHNVTDKVTPLFGQASWSLGVWQGDAAKLTIIDSAQLIMPERQIRLADEGYQFFIQLDRSPWALACQEICDTITLVHDSIKWRGDSSKRPWLAGTVISEMCALLDVPGLLKLLNENSRVRSRR